MAISKRRSPVENLRFASQTFSLTVNLAIGLQFAIWANAISQGHVNTGVARPPGVEGWLPIGSLVALKHWWATGQITPVHPAGLMILLTIFGTSLMFKKGFCSWICPAGFAVEWIGKAGEWALKRRLTPPRWLDWPLRSLKYLLLAFFVMAIVVGMDAVQTSQFLDGDYNAVADILMLRFFTHISPTALGILMFLFGMSFFIRSFWCRYLCPYGALLGLAGLLSPTRLRRTESACISCLKCTKVCPQRIQVHKVREVVSDECTGCMACVASCSAKSTLGVSVVTPRFQLSAKTWGIALIAFFWGSLLLFRLFGPWQSQVPPERLASIMSEVEAGRTLTH